MKFENFELKWLGNSGFLISVDSGENIYIDPYKIPAGIRNNKAEIILITHPHPDHCSIEDLQRIVKDGTIIICPSDCQSKLTRLKERIDIKPIESGKIMDIGNLEIKAVAAYNTNKQFHPQDEAGVGYIINLYGKTIYHAGDTDLIPEMNSLGKVDIALLPVGGTYTMNFEEAVLAVRTIKPGLSIPMHYGLVVGSEEDALKFVQECKNEGFEAEKLGVGR